MGIREKREKAESRFQDAMDKCAMTPHCLAISLVEFLLAFSMVALTMGLACVIAGVSVTGIATPMICATCMGIHLIGISIVTLCVIRWPGRKMVSFHIANMILHILLVMTCLIVDTLELGTDLVKNYRASLQSCRDTTTVKPPSKTESEVGIAMAVTPLVIYLETIGFVFALIGLVAGIRFRRYVTSRQRYDLARSSRSEIGHVFAVETRLPLPWPPFKRRDSAAPMPTDPPAKTPATTSKEAAATAVVVVKDSKATTTVPPNENKIAKNV